MHPMKVHGDVEVQRNSFLTSVLAEGVGRLAQSV